MRVGFNFHQSAVIPYRIKNGSIEILLVTSIKKKKWIIPKGYIEYGYSPFDSAVKEAYEEAGIVGAKNGFELGKINVIKDVGKLDVIVYSLEVKELLTFYPDENLRKRKWFSIQEAENVIANIEIVEMLNTLKKRIKDLGLI